MTRKYTPEELQQARLDFGRPMGVAVLKMLVTVRELTLEQIEKLKTTTTTPEFEGLWLDMGNWFSTETARPLISRLWPAIEAAIRANPNIPFGGLAARSPIFETIQGAMFAGMLDSEGRRILLQRWMEAGLEVPEELTQSAFVVRG